MQCVFFSQRQLNRIVPALHNLNPLGSFSGKWQETEGRQGKGAPLACLPFSVLPDRGTTTNFGFNVKTNSPTHKNRVKNLMFRDL